MTELELIQELLEDTGRFVREKYADRTSLEITSKRHPNDLLTEVDLAVQDRIVARVREVFPADAIAAEERDFSRLPSEIPPRCWVIDPIDGTQNFVRGILPAFGVSIGFAINGRAAAGGIAMPILGETFLAERGAGATRNGRPLKVSDVRQASMARLEVDFSGPPERAETLRRTSRLICTCGQIRCNCATVVALCSVASGDMEAFIHVALNPWDYAAGQLIVEEAGGRATRLDGRPLEIFDGGRGVLISNGHTHDELLGMVD